MPSPGSSRPLRLLPASQGGTLFLDEIGEAAPELQVLLLRCLESFNANVGRALDLGGMAPEEVTEQLYGTTDMINYAGNMVYTAVGDDVLEEAGEALLLVLGI